MMDQPKRILILGGGFGGVYCARHLESLLDGEYQIEITLVSEQNFFVFTPMLPQVVSGMIESNHIVSPIRQILTKTHFFEASVTSIDTTKRQVSIQIDGQDRRVLQYDHLVVALGSATNFAGMAGPNNSVFALKNLKDALKLRNHIIDMLERADIANDGGLSNQLQSFVVVGGGLSGVETAAELGSFLRKVIKYYPNLDRSGSRPAITIVQSRDRILPEFTPSIAQYTLKQLASDGISVILNSRVTSVRAGSVVLLEKGGGESTIPAGTVIWTAGISPISVTASIPCQKSNTGRLPVDSFLRVQGHQDIWAVGDCALLADSNTGEAFPSTAQYAIREAELVASNIATLLGRENRQLEAFGYKRDFQMAVIGDRTAIARIAGRDLSGVLIWVLSRIIYLNKLPMFKKRLRVLFDWVIDAFFDPDLTHIRGLEESRTTNPKAAEPA